MLLELIHLKKEYSRDREIFSAVDDASLVIGEGELVCVTGKSGSGKTTFLSMIAGLIEPTSGSVVFNGVNLTELKDGELSLLRNTKIGYIPQGQSTLGNFSVMDNILLPFYLHKRSGNPLERASYLMEQTGIAHLSKSYPAQLSGGELRRVTIVRSLINEPQLLLADEPTGDLDPETLEDVMKLFVKISHDGVSIILVSHDANVVSYKDRHFSMESGHLTEK
jgi:putative ABC transport system ATP-binding protein